MLPFEVILKKVDDWNRGITPGFPVAKTYDNLIRLLEKGIKIKRVEPQHNDPDIINFWMETIKRHGYGSQVSRQCPLSVLMDVLQYDVPPAPKNHGNPWSETANAILRLEHNRLSNKIGLRGDRLRLEDFKEWLKFAAKCLGRKEEAVMAHMSKLGLYLKRFHFVANIEYHDDVSNYFSRIQPDSTDKTWYALLEHLQRKQEIKDTEELERKRAGVSRENLLINIHEGEYVLTGSMKKSLRNYVTQAIRAGQTMNAERDRQALIKERASLTNLRNYMTNHSVKYPGSSVESFDLEYSKLLTRLSKLDKLINN